MDKLETQVKYFTDIIRMALADPLTAGYIRELEGDRLSASNDMPGDSLPPPKTLADIRHKLPYLVSKLPKMTTHVGQLKLFLTELEFLTDILGGRPEGINAAAVVTYAGSAPSMHLPFLLELFPNVCFILVDPNEHLLFWADDTKSRQSIKTVSHYELIRAKDSRADGIVYLRPGTDFRYGQRRTVRVLAPESYADIRDGTRPKLKLVTADVGPKDVPINLDLTSAALAEAAANLLESDDSGRRHRVLIVEDLFTNDTAAFVNRVGQLLPKDRRPMYFFSDIRTNLPSMLRWVADLNKIRPEDIKMRTWAAKGGNEYKEKGTDYEEEYPPEIDILANSAMQQNWLLIMRPEMSMLKFRCPFIDADQQKYIEKLGQLEPYKSAFDLAKAGGLSDLAKAGGIDYIADYMKGVFRYMKPWRICIQAYPGKTSTETRLYVARADIDTIVDYDIADYENRLFYWNLLQRSLGRHAVPAELRAKVVGLDCCGDCALLVKLFEEYRELKGQKRDDVELADELNRLLRYLGRSLVSIKDGHGLESGGAITKDNSKKSEKLKKSKSPTSSAAERLLSAAMAAPLQQYYKVADKYRTK
jgi:Poly A polymerase regulatory subunit